MTVYEVRFWGNYSDRQYGYSPHATEFAASKSTADAWAKAWMDLNPEWHSVSVTKLTVRKRMPKFIVDHYKADE